MKFLELLEKAWLTGIVVSFVLGVVNIFVGKTANQIYMPFICCAGCVLIYMNVRGQRRFKEKMLQMDKEPKPENVTDSKD